MRLDKPFIAGLLAVVLISLIAGFLLGSHYSRKSQQQAVDAEYTRVVAAIAQTMRCSTPEEFDAGVDHECAPWEIEQDAGLADADGRKLIDCDSQADCLEKNGEYSATHIEPCNTDSDCVEKNGSDF